MKDYVKPACLPRKPIAEQPGSICYVSGWGHTQPVRIDQIVIYIASSGFPWHVIIIHELMLKQKKILPYSLQFSPNDTDNSVNGSPCYFGLWKEKFMPAFIFKKNCTGLLF